jgi:hypothetical protein
MRPAMSSAGRRCVAPVQDALIYRPEMRGSCRLVTRMDVTIFWAGAGDCAAGEAARNTAAAPARPGQLSPPSTDLSDRRRSHPGTPRKSRSRTPVNRTQPGQDVHGQAATRGAIKKRGSIRNSDWSRSRRRGPLLRTGVSMPSGSSHIFRSNAAVNGVILNSMSRSVSRRLAWGRRGSGPDGLAVFHPVGVKDGSPRPRPAYAGGS